MLIKLLLVVCALAFAATARAEDWVAPHAIPLDRLPPDQQADLIDAGRRDAATSAAVGRWSQATSDLVRFARHRAAVTAAGIDLTAAGIR